MFRRPVAVVPLKSAGSAKARLAHRLDRRQRGVLVRALARHVVEVLDEAGLRTILLTGDGGPPDVDVEVWPDGGMGLNAALREAMARLEPPVLVLPADLPWVTTGDVETLIDTDAEVAIAVAHDGGTNGLLLRQSIAPAFGPGSALRHARAARDAGWRASVRRIDGLWLDLDDEAALSRALAGAPGIPPDLVERLGPARV